MRRVCSLTVLVAGAALAIATPTFAQTLNSELASLLANNPRLRASEKTLSASDESVRKAQAGFLPVVSLAGTKGYEHVDSPARRGASTYSPYSRSSQSSTLTVTQNLFDGWKTTAGIDGANASRRATAFGHEATLQTVMLEGIQAYLDVLKSVQLSEYARENVETVQKQLELEDERVQRGGGIAVDVLLAKTRLQLAKEKLVSFRSQMREAQARYQQLFGREPDPDSLVEPTPPVQHLPGTIEEATQIARDGNPNIGAARLQIEATDAKRRVSQGDLFPKVDLVGKYNWEDNVDTVAGVRRDASLILKSTWEVFSGFATRAAIAESSLQHAAARDTAAYTTRKTEEETRLAWNELHSARERVQLLTNAVNIAAEVFDNRRKLRDSGKETALAVLDAENELYNARINFLNAAFDARKATYKLMSAIGRLTPEFLGVTAADYQTRRSPG
ncbi:MAG: TolC family outer membrane protein [Alphaproteobacteria bacterium]|nr:TolC family outer membrane protein [Alphaproteobacteria bacterium]